MRIPDFKNFSPFEDLKRKMGVEKLGEFNLNFSWKPLTENEIDQLNNNGIEVRPEDLRFLHDKTIAYKNRRVLVYIRDVRGYSNERISMPRFHIAFCKTLDSMRRADRFNSRYVVSTRTDGTFAINKPNNYGFVSRLEKLDVCKNCLSELNFNNYNFDRGNAFKDFNLDDFFLRYSCSPLHITPNETDRTAPVNQYPSDWNHKSLQFRRDSNWICANCRRDFSSPNLQRFLHAHHLNGNTYNCRPSNLKALCIKCHADEPYHSHVKELPTYKEYIRILRENGYLG